MSKLHLSPTTRLTLLATLFCAAVLHSCGSDSDVPQTVAFQTLPKPPTDYGSCPAFDIFAGVPWDPCEPPPPFEPPGGCNEMPDAEAESEQELADSLTEDNDLESRRDTYTDLYLTYLKDWLDHLADWYPGGGPEIDLGDPASMVIGSPHVARIESLVHARRMNVVSGPFGASWHSSLFEQLELGDPNIIYWQPGDGRKFRFDRQTGTNTFVGEAKLKGRTLTAYPSGSPTYILTTPYGDMTDFDANGRIMARRDACGNARTFERDPSSQRLLRVRDPLGRELHALSYFPSGRVSALEMLGDYALGFSYDTNDNLAEIITPATDGFPEGKSVYFEYSSGFGNEELNHNLIEVRDCESATIISYEHDSDDRVTLASLGNCTWSVQYQQPVPGTYANVVTDPRGIAEEYWFTPASGYQIAKHVVHAQSPPICAGSPASWTHEYAYDAAGRLTKAVWPSGKRLDVTRDASGNATAYRYKKINTDQSSADDLLHTVAFNSARRPTSYTTPEGGTYQFTWDPTTGHMSTFQYPTVNAFGAPQTAISQYEWYSNGQFKSRTNPIGTKAELQHDAATGYVTQLSFDPQTTEPTVTATVQRNTAGRLTKLTAADGRETTFTRDAHGLTLATSDTKRLGTFEYDARNRQYRTKWAQKDQLGVPDPDLPEIVRTKTFNPFNDVSTLSITRGPNDTPVWTYERDAWSNITAVVTPASRRKTIAYDERNLACSATIGAGTPQASTTTFTWDVDGRHTGLAVPGPKQVNYEYDGHGLLTKTIAPNGAYAKRTYQNGREVKTLEVYDATDTLQAKREFTYDERSRPYLVDYHRFGPGLSNSVVTESRELDPGSRATKVLDPLGTATEVDYSWRSQPVQLRFPSQAVEDGTYDAAGNPTSFQIQDGTRIARGSATYDIARRPVTYSWEDGQNPGQARTVVYEYDSLDRVRKFADANGDVVRYKYDGTGNLTTLIREIRNAAGQVIATETERALYDADGVLTEVKNANGNSTFYTRDALGRNTGIQLPNGDTWAATFNADNSLATRTDANGTVISYSYDSASQLAGITATLASGVIGPTSSTFTRDGIGRVVSMTDGTNTIGRTLDSLGQVLSDTQGTFTTQKAWDPRGVPAGLTYPGGLNLGFQRDNEARLTAITQGTSTVLTQTWNVAEGLTSRTHGSGVVESIVRDGFQDVTSINVALGAVQHVGFTYGYTNRGLPAYEARAHRGGTGPVYGYDSDGQLARTLRGVANPAQEFASPGSQPYTTKIDYGFDAAKSRTAVTTTPFAGTPTTLVETVNAAAQIVASGGTALAYDLNGNLVDDGTRLYRYDFRNLVRDVRLKSTGAIIATYDHDPEGRRVRKATAAGTTQYVYDGLHVIEERDGAGNLQRSWVHTDTLDHPTHLLTPTGSYALHRDRLGSVVAVTDAAGAVVETVDYDEHGNPSFFGPTGTPLAASTVGNTVLFTSQRYDTETGLYYYKARMYSPAHGRFLHRDPLLYIDGLNPYGYASNSPTFFLDPLGLGATGWGWLDGALDSVADLRDDILGADNAEAVRNAVGNALAMERDEVVAAATGVKKGATNVAVATANGTAQTLGAVGGIGAGLIGQDITSLSAIANDDSLLGYFAAGAAAPWDAANDLAMGPSNLGRAMMQQMQDLASGTLSTEEAFEKGTELLCELAPILAGAAGKGTGKPGTAAAGAEEAAAGRTGRACFFAGTLVATEAGPRPIEDVRAGDRVWSFDPQSGTWVLQEVEEHLVHEYRGDLITIHVGDGSIAATGNHPFWVVGGAKLAGRTQVCGLEGENGEAGRWVEARCLTAGDSLLGRHGPVAITGVGRVRAMCQVHNLRVAGFHTYSVGLPPVVVHNKPVKMIPGEPFKGPDAAKRAFEHLKDKHGLDPHLASKRLHEIKKSKGLGGADDAVIGKTGDVYDPATGEHIGNLILPRKK